MTKSDKKKPRYYIGVVLVTLFALLCVIPLIYMICVSFAQTSTMYIKFALRIMTYSEMKTTCVGIIIVASTMLKRGFLPGMGFFSKP